MKKHLLSLCLPLVLACSSFSANAAVLLGLDAGVYVWQASTTGTAGAQNTAGLEEDNNVAYFAFEHPIPMIPNVKVQTTDMAVGAGATLVDLTHTDSILYYEILDNFISVDVGIAQRDFDGNYNNSATQIVMTDSVIMLYASAEVEIPITGLSAGMEVSKDIGADDNAIDDVKIRVRYKILGGLGIEVGQRTVTMSLKEAPQNTTDLEFDGSYLAVTYTF